MFKIVMREHPIKQGILKEFSEKPMERRDNVET